MLVFFPYCVIIETKYWGLQTLYTINKLKCDSKLITPANMNIAPLIINNIVFSQRECDY